MDDPERADEIEDESLEDYAERRRIKIQNPKGVKRMAIRSRKDLLERIEELETENEDLQSRLDDIKDLVADEEEEGEE